MLNILEEFYYGNLNPNEKLKVQDLEYDECTKYAQKSKAELLENLNEKEKAIYENFLLNYDTIHSKELIQAFINGYKVGSLMTMEVLIDKESLYEFQ